MANIPGKSHAESLAERCKDPEYAVGYIECLRREFRDQLAEARRRLELSKSQRNAAVEAERLDADKAFHALADARIVTPENGYGYNSSWAISDLCRAVKDLHGKFAASQQRERELTGLLREVLEWVDGWSPNFEDEPEWAETESRIKAALRAIPEGKP